MNVQWKFQIFCSQFYFIALFVDNSFRFSHISKVFLNNCSLASLAVLCFVLWGCAEHHLKFSAPVLYHSHWSIQDALTHFHVLLGRGAVLTLGESFVNFKITLCVLENMWLFFQLYPVTIDSTIKEEYLSKHGLLKGGPEKNPLGKNCAYLWWLRLQHLFNLTCIPLW